jgi:cytosine/adenosine deaminase-related metal-dependent hydrolase/ubiquinone/menaquinone biosynthesis C-methylase UbiE
MGTPADRPSQTQSGEFVVSQLTPRDVEQVPAQLAYAGIAEHYDSLPNPMLSLEQRYLASLLPDFRDRDVFDLGCGTGRWLERVASQKPRSLVGVDISAEMLAVAVRKVPSAQLVQADASTARIGEDAFDIVLGSFLLGYVDDLQRLGRKIRQMLRRGGLVVCSDVHPETALVLGWKRGFHDITPVSYSHDLSLILRTFQELGLELECLLEPHFGDAEREIFRSAGRSDFEEAAAFPAIYIAAFRREGQHRAPSYTLRGTRVAITATESVAADLVISEDRISRLASAAYSSRTVEELDLSGHLLLPGLINAHDHLEFALFPRLGHGKYPNATEWAGDIQSSSAATIKRHRRVDRQTRLWWGGLRNLLAGVTSVCHHNPYEAATFTEDFPVHVVHSFGWAHSLAFDDVAMRHAECGADEPFILHAGEGVDASSASELEHLCSLGVLDPRCVLVHGLALTDDDIELLNESGASVVWCPSSNRFLFGRTIDARRLRKLKRIAMGTDSALTAAGDLVDELREASFHSDFSAQELYEFVTSSAARLLRLRNGEGRIAIEGVADLVAVRDSCRTEAEALSSVSAEDIELVISRGRVVLASSAMLERLSPETKAGLKPLEVEGLVRWVRAPLGKLFHDAVSQLGCDLMLGGKRVRHVSTDWL